MEKIKTKPLATKIQEPAFTKAQFLRAAGAFVPDVLVAVLQEGQTYTKAEAAKLCKAYLERKV